MSLFKGLPTPRPLLRMCCTSQADGDETPGLLAWGRMGEMKYESSRRIQQI